MVNKRLLNAEETARRIGYSVEWFYNNRQKLYRKGFPRPALGGDKPYGHARYDKHAIDAWLDQKMEQITVSINVQDSIKDWEDVLEQRAAEIST